MFPAFWPSPYSMNTSLYLNSSATFIDLPIIPSISTPPPAFTQQQVSSDDILPELFSGGKSTDYQKISETDLSTMISFETTTDEILPNGRFTTSFMSWNFTCSHLNPAYVQWKSYARHIYLFDMYGYQSTDDIVIKNTYDKLYLTVDLSIRRSFELYTETIVESDEEYFYINVKRTFYNSNGEEQNPPIRFTFNNKYKRQFQ
jgi:hypothetical protein